ncbi:MAG: SDR family NAD(P)-dependent oxidoreductase, partial [Burkholderiales bacterium]
MTLYATYPSLSGLPVFVTGGASGIGASLVRHFCLQHSRVSFVDIDAAAGEALRENLRAETGNAPLFIACDLTNIPALRAAIDQARGAIGEI